MTVTVALFKPSALGAGVTLAVVAGGVRSILTVTETELDPPAELVAVQVSTVAGVSAASVTGSHPTVLAMGTALVGTSTLDQFETALAAVAKGPLPAAALARLAALRQEIAAGR